MVTVGDVVTNTATFLLAVVAGPVAIVQANAMWLGIPFVSAPLLGVLGLGLWLHFTGFGHRIWRTEI